MNKKIIVIEGYLASGKSTFVRRLSEELGVPYLIKDTFKIALCKSIPINSMEEGRRFSPVTFDGMMYVTERMMEVGFPIIIEGNFVPAGMKETDEAGVIKALIEKYGYQSQTFKFRADIKVLHERYTERENSPERGDANRDFCVTPLDVFEKYCRNLEKFNIGGEVITIDTTNFTKVDFADYFEQARMFLIEELIHENCQKCKGE